MPIVLIDFFCTVSIVIERNIGDLRFFAALIAV